MLTPSERVLSNDKQYHEGQSVLPTETKSLYMDSADIKERVQHLFVSYLMGSGDFGWPPLLNYKQTKGQTQAKRPEICRAPPSKVNCCVSNHRSLQEV